MHANETTSENQHLTEKDVSQEQENNVNQQVIEAENKLNKINQEIKEQHINNIFNKYQIKLEFYDYLKFKTNDIENAEIENIVKQLIKEQPALRTPLNTGGNQQTVINNQTPIMINPLLDYKKKNYL